MLINIQNKSILLILIRGERTVYLFNYKSNNSKLKYKLTKPFSSFTII